MESFAKYEIIDCGHRFPLFENLSILNQLCFVSLIFRVDDAINTDRERFFATLQMDKLTDYLKDSRKTKKEQDRMSMSLCILLKKMLKMRMMNIAYLLEENEVKEVWGPNVIDIVAYQLTQYLLAASSPDNNEFNDMYDFLFVSRFEKGEL